MSKGPSTIKATITAAMKANPSRSFSLDELASIAYPGINLLEKKNRVATMRAARIFADRHHEPSREAGCRPAAERETEVMDYVFKPRRSAGPRSQHVGSEALGEDQPPAQHGRAVEPAREDQQANSASSDGEVRQSAAVSAVHPPRLCAAARADTGLRLGTNSDQRDVVVIPRILHDKAWRHESGSAKGLWHSVDPHQ